MGPRLRQRLERPHQARQLLELIEADEAEHAALAEDAAAFLEEALVCDAAASRVEPRLDGAAGERLVGGRLRRSPGARRQVRRLGPRIASPASPGSEPEATHIATDER